MRETLLTATRYMSRNAVLRAILPSITVTALLCGATAVGKIPVPGTPVPITLQTFVLMLAALTLDWQRAGAGVVMYLGLGAAGVPVFAGGGSTLALIGPSGGFLIGFLPSVIVAAVLAGGKRVPSTSAHKSDSPAVYRANRHATATVNPQVEPARNCAEPCAESTVLGASSFGTTLDSAPQTTWRHAVCALRCGITSQPIVHAVWRYALRALRYAAACTVGFLIVGYFFGAAFQSTVTGMPLSVTAISTLAFVPGDLLKIALASLLAAAASHSSSAPSPSTAL